MRTLILLALCAFACATFETRIPSESWLDEIIDLDDRQLQENVYRAQKEYRYLYNGQLCTGIPQSSRQHACTRIQAVVSLWFKTETQLLLKLTHIRMAQLNRHVPNPRQILPFQAYEEAEITQELKQKLRLPVMCKYQSGMIKDIVFDGDEQPWSANIKRGVLNMLQVNLKQHARTDLSEEQLLLNGVQAPKDPEYDFFAVQEKTIEGDCETFYTVTKQPNIWWSGEREVLNVTKTINFEKCQKRPEIKYNQRFGSMCPTCDKKMADQENVLESSTVFRYNISGNVNEFLIEKACVESQYMFAPINEQTDIVATYVNQTLVLLKSGPVESRIEEPQNPQESDSQMIFTPDWDILKEKFFMYGDEAFLQNSPYSEIKNKVKIVKEILLRLIAYTRHEREGFQQETPRQLARLVKIFRMCTQQELNQIHQKIVEQMEGIERSEQQKIKDIVVDALALAATKNTISHLVKNIVQKKIHPLKAALSLKSLVNSRVVSKQQIDIVMDLCKHQVSKRNPVLKQSCYLTVGSMINAMCKINKDKLAMEFKIREEKLCPRQLKEKYVQELIELFEQAPTQYEKILALKTLANAGIDLSVFELEKIIRNIGINEQTVVRMQAIDALRHLRSVMPRKIQKMLLPVYKNKYEQCELRMTAVYHILQTLPEKAILDQIAQQLMQERCQHIVTFVNTLLSTYANSTIPCEKKMAEDLQLSLRHAQSLPLVQKLGMSRFYHLTAYCQKNNFGGAINIGSMFSNNSYLPKELFVGIDQVLSGRWMKNVLQAGVVQQNGEELIERLLGSQGLLYEKSFSQLFTRAKRAIQQPKGLLQQIYQKLGISPRRERNQQPMAMFYMRFMNQDYAILPIDQETMPESIREMVQESSQQINIQKIQEFLSQGYHLDIHTAAFIHECQRKIPTTIGIPLLAGGKIPTVAGVKGFVKAQFEPLKKLEKIQIEINAKPKMAMTAIVKVEAWTPIVNTGLKLIRSAQINVPISGEMLIDIQKDQPVLEVKMNLPEKEIQLLHLDSRPVTFTRQWPKFLRTYAEPEETTVFCEEWTRQRTINQKLGEHALGVQMNVRAKWHRYPSNAIAGTPFGAYAGHSFLQITTQPGQDAPKQVVLKATGEIFSELEDNFELIPEEFEQFYKTDSEMELFEDEYLEKPRSHFQKFHKYAKSYRGVNPMKHRLAVELKTHGSSVPRKAEMIAKCNCDQTMRLCKWQLEVMRTAIPSGPYSERQPWELVAQGQMLYPQIPYTLKQLQHFDINEHQKCGIKVECEWGPKGNKQQFVNFKVQAEKSQEQKKLQARSLYQQTYEQQMETELFSPVMQYDQLLKQAMLTKYKIHCDYQVNNVYLKNITNKAYRLFKQYNYWNTDVNQISVRNPQNQIQAVIELCPRSLQYLNVTARLPQENIRVQDMALFAPIKPINIRRSSSPIRSFTELIKSYTSKYIEQPKCVVSSQRIQTFDQVKYRVPLTTCYSVLAKDCSGYDEQPKFAVMIKKLQQNKEAKKVKIISQNHVIELEAKQQQYSIDEMDSVKIIVDGQRISLQQEDGIKVLRKHEHIVCKIEKTGPYVKVVLPEESLQVYFDGFACAIKTSPMYTNAQCGLCGHYDGDSMDEWRNPQNELTWDLKDFHKSYFHQDDECDIDQQVIDSEDSYGYKPYLWEDEQWEEQIENKTPIWEDDSSSSSQESHEQQFFSEQYSRELWQPRPMTKVIEMSHEICFSKKPVPQCPRNTYPVEAQQKPKKVSFGCLPRSSSEALSLRQLVRKQGKVIEEAQTLPQSMVDTVMVPKMCKQF